MLHCFAKHGFHNIFEEKVARISWNKTKMALIFLLF